MYIAQVFSCPKLLRLSYALADTFSSFWEWHDPKGKWGSLERLCLRKKGKWGSLERLCLRLSSLCLRLLYACVFACVPGDAEVDVYVHTVMRPPTLLSCSLTYILLQSQVRDGCVEEAPRLSVVDAGTTCVFSQVLLLTGRVHPPGLAG